ncbi:MAG TPA: UDP-2,3-diacylglucosamine diphosphatase [Bacteroidales bacterium]|nr:UDP-2,3-diacylglucosamine diphosphatase [Bacteroidales bacterium]
MKPGKKIYFASDFHLGAPGRAESLQREKLLVKWLNEIQPQAEALYLLGDIFDFWFEYKKAVPKGFVRFLGKMAEFCDQGIPVHFFTGNHDLWIFDYLPREVGFIIHREPLAVRLGERHFYMAHGDGLGHGDGRYRLLKKVFTNPLAQWLFGRLHPNLGISLAHSWSLSSRNVHQEPEEFRGEQKEMLVQHARQMLEKDHFDYLIFGHRHVAVDYPLNEHSRYINLGDWIDHYTYGEFDGREFHLKTYTSSSG